MALPKLIQPTDGNFESEILKSDLPSVVCFWSSWSGPCKILAPVIAEMAERHGTNFRVAMLNVDENPMTPTIYGVRTLPTFLVFRDHEVVRRVQGAVPRSEIDALFDPELLRG